MTPEQTPSLTRDEATVVHAVVAKLSRRAGKQVSLNGLVARWKAC